MGRSVSRRHLFSNRWQAALDIRPPGAITEDRFIEVCNRCGDCRRACPTGIVIAGDGGFPALDFRRGECTFCGRCAAACRPGVLAVRADIPALPVAAVIGEGCLSAAEVTCRVCGDRCDARAIGFRLQFGGRAFPMIDDGRCNGCGACVAPCPARAITMQPPQETTRCA